MKKVDIDNCENFVMDALSGIIYDDDKCIVESESRKLWDCNDECNGSTSVDITVLVDNDVGTAGINIK